MRNTAETWRIAGFCIKIEDVKGREWTGFIESFDEIGISLREEKGEHKRILLPWTAICVIYRI